MRVVDRFLEFGAREAMIWRGQTVTYTELFCEIGRWKRRMKKLGIEPGDSVAVCGDYNPNTTALLLALASRGCIAVPIAPGTPEQREEQMQTAEATVRLDFEGTKLRRLTRRAAPAAPHLLLRRLRAQGRAGLVLFSSGSTGRSKAILLDFTKMLEKLNAREVGYRTLAFLVWGHIGGVNTVLRALADGGTLVMIESRQPSEVGAAIEQHRVELLPTTPTFLAMVLMADVSHHYCMSSLRLVTYGTEPMPPSTLASLAQALPNVRFKQTYGLSEVGILPTKSKSSDSLFMKVGGPGYETRVVDGVLWVRSDTAMLGYLNAPSPFTEDGWYNTGDAVEVDGDYLRVLGRASDLINVGGEKVYPAEVESALLQVSNVRDAVVFGARNPVTGQIVRARVALAEPEDPRAFERRARMQLRANLAPYMVPALIEVADAQLHGPRFKKSRMMAEGSA